jgi:hypothetical protein
VVIFETESCFLPRPAWADLPILCFLQ